MKKEYQIVAIIGLFAFAYALDYFAGPVVILIKNPFIIGNFLQKFPFTAVGIVARSIAIVLTTTLVLSLSEKGLLKAFIAFFLAGLFELYAIQQLATLSKMTSTQWTLSFAYGGLLMIIPIVLYLISGIVKSLHSSLNGTPEREDPGQVLEEEETESTE